MQPDQARRLATFLVLLAAAGQTVAAERLWVYRTTGGFLDSSPAIGDVDRDGSPDILVTSTAGPVFALDAQGRLIWRVDLDDPITIAPTLADVLGDPGLEVLVLTQTGRLACLEGLTGDVIWENTELGAVKWGAMTVVVADLDQDGSAEIVAADMAGKLVCLTGTGEVEWIYEEAEGIGSAPAVGDVDGDGKAEIVIATPETPLVCLRHDGTVLWRMTETTDTWAGRLKREVSAPVVWDLDRDGRPEILVGIGRALAAVSGKGNLLWTYGMANQIDSAISVADADNDGEVEIYAADLSGKFACVTAAGREKWSTSLGSRARRSPAIADVDGDGDVEVLVAGYSGKVHVFGADGKEEQSLVVNGNSNATPTVTDLLGDGGLCAVVPEISGDLVVYRWQPVRKQPAIPWPEYRFSRSRVASGFAARKRRAGTDFAAVRLGNYDAESAVFEVEAVNPERRQLTIRLRLSKNDETVAEAADSSSNERLAARLAYQPATLAGARVVFSCTLLRADKVLARHAYTVDVVPLAERVARLDRTLSELSALISTLPDPVGIRAQAHYLKGMAAERRAQVDRASDLAALARRSLHAELVSFQQTASRLLAIARQAAREERVLAVYAANPWAPFGGMNEIVEGRTPAAALPSSDAADCVLVEAFQGEIESAAVNVVNFGGTTRMLRVLVGDLTREQDGATRSATDVLTLREVVAVPTQRADKSADALPRLGQGETLMVPPWQARQLWLTVATAQLAAGTWQAKVQLRSLDVTPREATAEVTIKVWDTALPKERRLKLCHWSPTNLIKGSLEDQVAHGTSIFVGGVPGKATFDADGNLVGEIDFADHDAYMLRRATHGVVLFHRLASLTGPAAEFTPVWQKAYSQFLQAWVRHLADLGFGYDSFAFYPVDEPGLQGGPLIEILLKWATATDQADPRIQIYTNPGPNISMKDYRRMGRYVDIWSPGYLARFPQDKLAYMHTTNGQYWHYTCSHDAKHLSPLGYYRGQAWLAWHFGHTGIGFWTYFNSGADPWFMPASGADYEMVYQGDGVVTSKRWEAVRDGIEDYALLDALRQAAAAAEAQGLKSELVQKARLVCGDEAKRIARFCDWDDDGTVPGKGGLPAARVLADKRWQIVQATRRKIATLLAALRRES